jgi:molybdopterin converting factor small subunit
MEITVQFEAQLRHVAGVGQASLTVPDGERLVAADGTAQRSVLLFVNDKPIAHAAVAEERLKAGDVLLLYPPISGG